MMMPTKGMIRLKILVCAICLCSVSGISQDTIVLTNGLKLIVSVFEINTDSIKFKDYDDPSGHFKFLSGNEIRSVIFSNGEIRHFTDSSPDDLVKASALTSRYGLWGVRVKLNRKILTSREIKLLYSDHQNALRKYRSGKALNEVGHAFTLPACAIIASVLLEVLLIDEGQMDVGKTGALVVGCAGLLTGTLLTVGGNNMIMRSVEIYNSEIHDITQIRLKAGFTKNGAGLCLLF
jgi:hypothetical protein